jgi:hypothetical protein
MSRIALIAIALLAAPLLQAQPDFGAQASRFALKSSSLQESSGATSDQRFQVSAQLQRREQSVISESYGIRLTAKLVRDTHGTCTIPMLLFRDGFEPAA